MTLQPGQSQVSVEVDVVEDSGLPVSALVAATFPPVYYSTGGASDNIAIALIDLAAITDPWTPGGVIEKTGGGYRLDLPAQAIVAGLTLRGEASGKHLIADIDFDIDESAPTPATEDDEDWAHGWLGDTQAGDVSWYYANQRAVTDLLGDDNLGIAFDLDDDGTIDTDAVLRAGQWSDNYIDLALRKQDQTAPNPLTDATVTGILKSASAHLAAWYGFHQRGLNDASNGTRANQTISGIMDGYKKLADDLIASAIAVLEAEGTEETWRQGGDATAITPVYANNSTGYFAARCRYPDSVPILW